MLTKAEVDELIAERDALKMEIISTSEIAAVANTQAVRYMQERDALRITLEQVRERCEVECIGHIIPERDALRREVEAARPWAEFGSWAFEAYFQDGEPGDIDWPDAQEQAVKLGLLRRRIESDDNSSCGDGCEWQPGQPLSECECLFPTRGRYHANEAREAAQRKGDAT